MYYKENKKNKNWGGVVTISITTPKNCNDLPFSFHLFLKKIEQFKDAIQKKKKLYIIGTSLGAATAAYIVSFLLDLYDELNQPRNIIGICIASPRCLTVARNAKVYEYIFSIVNMFDPITYLPLGNMVLPGRIIAIQEKDNDISFTLYENIASYSDAAKEYLSKTEKTRSIFPYHKVKTYSEYIALLKVPAWQVL